MARRLQPVRKSKYGTNQNKVQQNRRRRHGRKPVYTIENTAIECDQGDQQQIGERNSGEFNRQRKSIRRRNETRRHNIHYPGHGEFHGKGQREQDHAHHGQYIACKSLGCSHTVCFERSGKKRYKSDRE